MFTAIGSGGRPAPICRLGPVEARVSAPDMENERARATAVCVSQRLHHVLLNDILTEELDRADRAGSALWRFVGEPADSLREDAGPEYYPLTGEAI